MSTARRPQSAKVRRTTYRAHDTYSTKSRGDAYRHASGPISATVRRNLREDDAR